LHCLLLVDSEEFLLRQSTRYPLLTPLQEVLLGRQIRAWRDHPDGPDLAPLKIRRTGKRALDRFVCSNIRLAYTIARRYENRGVPMEDLLQSAIEGLILAYQRFKPDLGYRSSSYATWYAKQGCQLAVAKMGSAVRLPLTVNEQLRRIYISREVFREKNGREPTEAELSSASGLDCQTIRNARDVANDCTATSLDRLAESGEHPTAPSSLDRQLHMLHCHENLRQHIAALGDPQTRAVLMLRHLAGDPQSEVRIAQALNLNRQTVARLEREGLAQLARRLDGQKEDYLSLVAA
jgi:RNA polymerase primary sigma factor